MAQLAERLIDPETAHDPQIEARRANRLLYYWQSLRRIEGIPAYVDFDPRRNPLPWNQCFLLYRGADSRLVFDLFGAELLPLVGDAPAAPVDVPRATVLDELLEGLPFLLSRGQPWKHDGETATRLGFAKHRSVLLPFRDIRRNLAYVMGGVTFKVFASEAA
jgi:hypothetical protein